MSASFKRRCDNAQFDLIRMSANRLQDDTKTGRLTPPLKPATATIAECLASKGVWASQDIGYVGGDC